MQKIAHNMQKIAHNKQKIAHNMQYRYICLYGTDTAKLLDLVVQLFFLCMIWFCNALNKLSIFSCKHNSSIVADFSNTCYG